MIELPELKTNNDLFLFLIHTIHDRFRDNAILKGGMVLKLLGSGRHTIDLDYTFVPFSSKNAILGKVEKLFSEISNLKYSITTNSKAIRIQLETQGFKSQVEINVAKQVKSDVISTANLKEESNPTPPRIIKIMSLDVALSHKLAAWNERRLLRDLYDVYYFLQVQNIAPDIATLEARLSKVQSRKPELKKIKKMKLKTFLDHLKKELDNLAQKDIENELTGLLCPIALKVYHQIRMKVYHS